LSGQAREFRELDDERVLVVFHMSGRGKASGLKLEQTWAKVAGLFYVRDGKVTRGVFYFDHERALADLGLPSEADSRARNSGCRLARRLSHEFRAAHENAAQRAASDQHLRFSFKWWPACAGGVS
jgi:hypothetical protein